MGEISVTVQRLAGSRIRQKRLDRGLRQADVAETVGISASYLNLIEHNRRRIGGKLLAEIARVLDVDPALLADGVDKELLNEMRNAAALLGVEVEVGQAEDLAARYPGWGSLFAAQSRRIAALEARAQALSDRVSFDPQLAEALHEVISSVTAIRSTASILVGPEALDADWQRRFHQNIHDDSVRLAKSSEALVAYLEAPEDSFDAKATVIEEVEAFLAVTGFHLAEIETGTDANTFASQAGLGKAAMARLEQIAAQYAQDAAMLPLTRLEAAIAAHGYDPSLLAHALHVPFAVVLRRLASLPKGGIHPPIGLAISDAAGVLLLLKTIPGFAMPRAGGACPLWPVFSAMGRPEQPVRLDVTLPAQGGARLRCYAIASAQMADGFDAPPVLQSTMIVLSDPDDPAPLVKSVGVSCRICPRQDCPSRREPAMTGLAAAQAL